MNLLPSLQVYVSVESWSVLPEDNHLYVLHLQKLIYHRRLVYLDTEMDVAVGAVQSALVTGW
jgi:hypothetical protein